MMVATEVDPPTEQDRITFVGDSHGNAAWLGFAIRAAESNGSHRLVQLGDFGLWPGHRGEVFLDEVAERLERHDVQLVFIDGNHDWHEQRLRLKPEEDGLVTLRPRLRYAPRGAVFEIAPGVRALAVGGAPSIDRDVRTQGVDWWPEEVLSFVEIERCLDAGPVDLVIAHDAPIEVPIPGIDDLWKPGVIHRKVMSALWSRARPRWWFSGHYHQRVSVIVDDPAGFATRFEVLDCDLAQNSGRGWVAVDFEALKLAGDDPSVEQIGEPPRQIRRADTPAS